MKHTKFVKLTGALVMSGIAATSFAAETEKEVQDMSDPMAIYTSGGISYGTNGLNLKMMKTLDTGSKTDLSAIIVEIKDMDFADDGDVRHGTERSSAPSNLRLRKFDVDMTTGRGISYDIMHNTDKDAGMLSVGVMQALPINSFWTAYPILGAGVWYAEDEQNGIDVPGVTLNLTMYNKFTVTDKIWLNWNLTYAEGIFGKEEFKDDRNSASDSLVHEFIASYQIDPRNNLRLWHNTSQDKMNEDDTGETRLEFNHQF